MKNNNIYCYLFNGFLCNKYAGYVLKLVVNLSDLHLHPSTNNDEDIRLKVTA